MYNLENYFGIDGNTLGAIDAVSSDAPAHLSTTAELPGGQRGTVASFTDWRRSPVFWLAVFAVFALGYIHAEGSVRLALK